MRLSAVVPALLVLSIVLAAWPPASALPPVALQPVATGLAQPVHVTNADDGSGRLFIVERAGVVKVVKNGALLPTPYLDIRPLVGSTGLEQGLLSVAFHPGYESNGRFFVSYTDRLGQNVLARYQVSANPDVADAGSASVLFTQLQPFPNHNGGLIVFGPDGYLYMGIGDGGSANDPLRNGQNGNSLLGKLLRLDVDVPVGYGIPLDNPFVTDPAVRDEVWAIGLRNPWRFSFDAGAPGGARAGELYIADVGQTQWEEVNHAAAGVGGQNYGWNAYEGNHAFQPQIVPSHIPFTFPVNEYNHSEGCSITGGHVYRGPAIAGLQGTYLFGDYCRGTIWGLTPGSWTRSALLASGLGISSFGEDEAGEVYVAHLGLVGGGAVYKIVPA